MSSINTPKPAANRLDPLNSFRGDMRAEAKLHPSEKRLVFIASVLLCFMPWALGSMHPWSQFINLGLASLGFIAAIINRHYRDDLAPNGDFKLVMWPRLIRFPVFWIGLILLSYIFIQAVNPAWVYMANSKYWWIAQVDHIKWLPSGIDGPFEDMNAWRVLIIYSTCWLLACALWMGITRRIAIQTLVTVIVANGALLAIVGILQRVTHAPNILWVLKNTTNTGGFFSTLIYKNHAGAYFNLLLMLSVSLLYLHFLKAERRLQRSSPAPVFAFCAVLLGLSVLLSLSRAGTILMILFVIIALVFFIIRCTVYQTEAHSPWSTVLICTIFALFIGTGAYFLKADETLSRISKLAQDGSADSSVSSRLKARAATWEMAKDELITGWGAGSFRHGFPTYQKRYPEILTANNKAKTVLSWKYAHNDYVQLIAEHGLVGAGIFLTLLICGIRHLLRQGAYLRPHLFFIILALGITAVHAWMDFPFHNPAILTLWCAVAVLLGRWSELENRRRSSSG